MEQFRIIGRRQVIITTACIVMLTLIFSIAASGAASSPISAPPKKLPIYAVGRSDSDKTISISFDAAWGNEDTQQLIDILGKRNIKVTFFVVGSWVDKFPQSVKELSDAGHEVMNHSNTHPHMPKLSRQQMIDEIESCNEKIEKITGKRPTLFRAPYGEYCDTLIEVLDELGMHCIQWDVDSLDWKDPTPEQICDRVCGNVCPGSVVLFHNAAKNTPAALPTLLDNLLSQGYTFVPISENIYYDNYKIDHTGRQWLETPATTATTATSAASSAKTSKTSKASKEAKKK